MKKNKEETQKREERELKPQLGKSQCYPERGSKKRIQTECHSQVGKRVRTWNRVYPNPERTMWKHLGAVCRDAPRCRANVA